MNYPYRVVIDDAVTVMPDDQRDVLELVRDELDWVGSGRLRVDLHRRLIVLTASSDEALRIADQVVALISERGWWIVVNVQKRDEEKSDWVDVEPGDEGVGAAADANDPLSFALSCPDWTTAAAKVIVVLPSETAADAFAAQMREAGIDALVDGRKVPIPSLNVEWAWLMRADLERIVPRGTKLRVRGHSPSEPGQGS